MKRVMIAGGIDRFDIHASDPGASGPRPDRSLNVRDRTGLPLGQHLYSAIG